MTDPVIPDELETAILAVYRGPLEEFVGRRDAQVKQLRAAKRREPADRVKALRKPSRMAWVLDNIVHEDVASIEQLAAAISEAQTGADLRTALETVKTAVRDVAAVGARVAVRAEQPIEPNAIITAVQAVIGDAGAFADWRAGRLVEVPEAGGLDLLTAITVRDQSNRTPTPSIPPPSLEPTRTDARAHAAAAMQDVELAKAARADLRRAEMLLAEVEERSEHAVRLVQNAKERHAAAERTLLQAQAEAQARHADLERARNDAEAAAAVLQDAERAVTAARARVADSGEG